MTTVTYEVEISKESQYEVDSYLACVSKKTYQNGKYLDQELLFMTQALSKQTALQAIKRYLHSMNLDNEDIICNGVPEQILLWDAIDQKKEYKPVSSFIYFDKHIFSLVEQHRSEEELAQYSDHIMKIQEFLDDNNNEFEFEVVLD